MAQKIIFDKVGVNKTGIKEFLAFTRQFPVVDVRSPGEYGHAHIPGAYNLPLFSDEERKMVGTAYKQEGREIAIKIGLDYFGGKMRKMLEEVEKITKANIQYPISKIEDTNSKFQIPNSQKKTVLVHCWRGGMRSAGVAWLLDLYGFKVYTLTGGYKAFRNWALQQFDKQYPFKVIGGYTGSGKTRVLQELAHKHNVIIDLEGIAHHKGSAFGDLDEPQQLTQEMFENKLALALDSACANENKDKDIWIEDESQRVGDVNIPITLWNSMRLAPVFFLEIPFEERLKYITQEYSKHKKEKLVSAIMRIQKRLGGLNTKNAINYLLEDNVAEAFRILLAYYDKYYTKGMQASGRVDDLLTSVPCTSISTKENTARLLSAYSNFTLRSVNKQGIGL